MRSTCVSLTLQRAGLAPVLNTDDFGCWEAALATTLGHHHSELLDARDPFEAHFRIGQLGPYGVMHLRGQGRLRLLREQWGHSVLWLPLRGLSEERINGSPWLGDAMQGQTSEEI